MLTVIRRICTKKFIRRLPADCSKISSFSTLCSNIFQAETLCYRGCQKNLEFYRYKSKDKKSKRQDTESETEESEKDFMDDIQDKNTKTIKVNVTSMRLDVILKSGLGLSRNKLETIFYESKVRLNGEKVLKKSVHVQNGDEIDIIKGNNVNNKDFLMVARVEILSAIGKEESISVKLRRCKSLTVENYEGKNRWED
ncbi:uncharacterized protein C6orf203 homolog [Anoplophora glabripennis]|uniref:uncharacterized protein C6orf203 homolog n=1 Tax=Anoplophora glabripennis TaxID=217634 RepID=UPI000874E029|nr:uncharacterized protein C6orf203 homolog [Anoplophora glabripennis]